MLIVPALIATIDAGQVPNAAAPNAAAPIATPNIIPNTLPNATSNSTLFPGLLPGFHRSPYFNEQTCETWIEPGVRVVFNVPAMLDSARPTRLIVYATPNGNTIEQTLGCAAQNSADAGTGEKPDWRYDIQHIAAQTRRLREVAPGENIVLACVEAEGLSWPAWRAKHPENRMLIRAVVDTLRARLPLRSLPTVDLIAHSGGGSFLWGFINSADTLPDWVERIGFLDANYSYSDAPTDRHGDKLLAWLKTSPDHHLVVIAYDDRELMLNGKKVVGSDGGTFRATQRMTQRFTQTISLTPAKTGVFDSETGLNGQVRFFVHPNPENIILHTALVGEMNGFLEATTAGSPIEGTWGTFGVVHRAYSAWIQPAYGIPPRPTDAMGGIAFMNSISALPLDQREERIAAEFLRGNVPDFLRKTVPVTVHATGADGAMHTATYQVFPDYLAIGSDADWVRVPMIPMTAQRIADAYGCMLSTRKICNDVYAAATVKLEPRPMTEAREAVATFLQHNAIVEAQRAGYPLGALIAGIQKDVVVANRLNEKPNRVAIYGWHKLNGTPIQPLVIVHRETYVDYSHGIRLVQRAVVVDGRTRDAHLVAHDPDLWPLLSDEGPLERPSY